MDRVILFHWKADEAPALLATLRGAGFDAELCSPDGFAGLRPFDTSPPRAFVISLDRLPSRGCEVALALRGRKATRPVPLVFTGGEAAKVAAIRRVLPDAHYAEWTTVGRVVREAIANPPAGRPLNPGNLAAYAGAPLPRKLGIKPGSVVALAGAPPRFERKLEPLPEGAAIALRARDADRVLLFAGSSRELAGRFAAASERVKEGGGLWIVWPKRASGVETDLTAEAVRRFAMDAGWVDYKICAVDETWSGLCFSRRSAKRKTTGA